MRIIFFKRVSCYQHHAQILLQLQTQQHNTKYYKGDLSHGIIPVILAKPIFLARLENLCGFPNTVVFTVQAGMTFDSTNHVFLITSHPKGKMLLKHLKYKRENGLGFSRKTICLDTYRYHICVCVYIYIYMQITYKHGSSARDLLFDKGKAQKFQPQQFAGHQISVHWETQ